jgi:pyridoxamine 5'-phosphate oxidase
VDERARPLLESDVDADPLRQFARWYAEAAEIVRAPEAVAVATASADGAPSVRMVLLKQFDARGFVFYTGYASRKGRELTANPRAALLFHWDPLGRQARVEGPVERVPREESEAYFRTRSRGSRVAAWVSRQSAPVESRDVLDTRFDEALAELPDDVPLPEHWGGFRLVPERYEFWQHREARLHDRLLYTRAPDGAWRLERLQP